MKIEIEKSEYDRLKSREEKLMAYYGWFVDKENDLATVEDIVNKNIELEGRIRFLEECLDNKEKVNKSLREDLKIWKLTAKDYAKLCWVDLDDDLNKIWRNL